MKERVTLSYGALACTAVVLFATLANSGAARAQTPGAASGNRPTNIALSARRAEPGTNEPSQTGPRQRDKTVPSEGARVSVTVTAVGSHKGTPPALTTRDVIVFQDRERRPVLNWVPVESGR